MGLVLFTLLLYYYYRRCQVESLIFFELFCRLSLAGYSCLYWLASMG